MNIQILIQDLNKHGLSDNEIARRTKTSQATISRLRAGISGGRLATANRIQTLHKEITTKDCYERSSN